MSKERHIYLLDNKKLNPETIAVTFAKTSRSPQSFDQIAQELSDEKSSEFHEKWVVGYGHASVAEHAVLHIAVENISRLAVECLESNRLASYTEKSSRYQVWDEEHYFIPDELKNTKLIDIYKSTVSALFQHYLEALPILQSRISEKLREGNREVSEREIHAHCMDVCRYYLPAAATANVGMTINARSLEHALQKMLSHPLEEVRQIGHEIKQVAITHLPTLVKYVDEVAYLKQADERTTALSAAKPALSPSGEKWCELVEYDKQFEERILSALLYRYGNSSFREYENSLKNYSDEKKRTLLDILFNQMGAHDIPLRELEYSWFLFDVVMDQGAYFEFKRHRMMSQTPQALSPYYGYAVPRLITDSGLEKHFNRAMELAKNAYKQIAPFNPHVASYVIPNAFNRRVLAGFNLRSAHHFIKLRSAPNAHFAIRRVACRMAEMITSKMDFFKPYFQFPQSETWEQIEEEYFTTTLQN